MMQKLHLVILWILALLFEAWAGWFMVRALPEKAIGTEAGVACLLHCLAVLFLFGAARGGEGPAARERLAGRYYSKMAGWLTLFMPGFGLACACLILLFKAMFKPKGLAQSYQEDSKLTIKVAAILGSIKDMDAYFHNELNVEPVRDIFRGRDEELKRGAISYLGRHPSRTAVRILQACVADANPDVRLYAHSALTRVEEGYVCRIQALHDHKDKKSRDSLSLGYAYRQYAESGLLDKGTADHYQKLAGKIFLKRLNDNGADSEALLNLAELYLALGRYEEAGRYFEQLTADHEQAAKALLALCRICFETGKFAEFVKTAAMLARLPESGNDDDDPQLTNLVSFWTAPLLKSAKPVAAS